MLFRLQLMHPEITIVWANSAHTGRFVNWAKTYLNLTINTVSRPKNAPGFVVLPRRWVVDEGLRVPECHLPAMAMLLVRRLTRPAS